MRERHGYSRERLARRLGVSRTRVFNWETGRTRIDLDSFSSLLEIFGYSFFKVLEESMFSPVSDLGSSHAEIFKSMRRRAGLSQQQCAKALGYKAAGIINHFERGKRTPSLHDLLKLMIICEDDVREFMQHITGDKEFASGFYLGRKVHFEGYLNYWSNYYISAMRQIMRTGWYNKTKPYQDGFFCKFLPIDRQQETYGLEILQSLNLIRFVDGKPEIIPGVSVVIPKNIDKDIIDKYKEDWLKFSLEQYKLQLGDDEINRLSIDVLPVNRKIYDGFVRKIKQVQGEIHNTSLEQTDSFASFIWLTQLCSVSEIKGGT